MKSWLFFGAVWPLGLSVGVVGIGLGVIAQGWLNQHLYDALPFGLIAGLGWFFVCLGILIRLSPKQTEAGQ